MLNCRRRLLLIGGHGEVGPLKLRTGPV